MTSPHYTDSEVMLAFVEYGKGEIPKYRLAEILATYAPGADSAMFDELKAYLYECIGEFQEIQDEAVREASNIPIKTVRSSRPKNRPSRLSRRAGTPVSLKKTWSWLKTH